MEKNNAPRVSVQSFGYKYGAPEGVSLMFDVRFLPNPYYDTALRPLCGLDEPVRKFMAAHAETTKFYEHMKEFTFYYIDKMMCAGRGVSIAFGCTGGRHRSVYLAQVMYEECRARGYDAQVLHRDLGGQR